MRSVEFSGSRTNILMFGSLSGSGPFYIDLTRGLWRKSRIRISKIWRDLATCHNQIKEHSGSFRWLHRHRTGLSRIYEPSKGNLSIVLYYFTSCACFRFLLNMFKLFKLIGLLCLCCSLYYKLARCLLYYYHFII